jgi:hypothetical protein
VTNFPLFPFLDGNQASRIQEVSPFACLLKHWKNIVQKVFSKSDSSFTALRLGHNILWEMRKDGQKDGALIIVPLFN